jgi:hypothetical protein|tara:strand:- start:1093 stop:1875 length:783 start_codon:yes stop_codon:yes gene_type:complete
MAKLDQKSYSMEVTVICHKIGLGLLSFISSLKRNEFQVQFVLVAPRAELHPMRLKQMQIRKELLGSSKNFPQQMRSVIARGLGLLGIKQIIIYLLCFLDSICNRYKIINLNNDWESSTQDCFNNISVMYSLEGLLSSEAIAKFKHGIINIHPAKLPEYRGLDGSVWALKDGQQAGVSAYLVDKGIDTGPMIKFFPLRSQRIISLNSHLVALKKLKYASYAEAIRSYRRGEIENLEPCVTKNQNRGVMSMRAMKEVVSQLQ